MKKKFLFVIFAFILLFTLTGCGETRHDISEYILEMEYKEDFKILQLTDFHLGIKDKREEHYEFISSVIEEAQADLIIVTGDIFTFADKTVASEFLSYMESKKTPWTCTFGNHDEQCYFSIDWFTEELNKLNQRRLDGEESYCYFRDIHNDDVFGYANFAINLMDGETVKEQIIVMDSNRYYFGEYIGYDYIKEDQIEWYERLTDYTMNELNNGSQVESLLFCHIPIPEFNDAIEAVETGDATLIMGEMREKICSPDAEYAPDFYSSLKENGTKAIIIGHDHINNFVVEYEGIYFAYGVKATDRVYYDEELLGGMTVTIKSDNSIEFNQLVHSEY